jgi:predicted aconitase
MKLTEEEQQMLDGKQGDIVRQSMELLVALGECYDAEHMIPIVSCHLVAPNPITAGKGGIAYIKSMAERGGRFVVPMTTDPASLEPCMWREMGFTEELYHEQIALSEAIAKMGGFLCNTCTPYLIGHYPRIREHVAWGESSAVIYANAVLGAKTNREGGPSALAAALTGRTPAYGFHLQEHRYGRLKIINTADLKCTSNYASLGYFIGKIAGDRVPIVTGISSSISQDEIKCFGAPLAVTGSVSHYHIVGVTPEASSEELASGGKRIGPSDTFGFGLKELKETEEALCAIGPDEADLVILGCPHASITQLKQYAFLFSNRKVKDRIDVWILTSRTTKSYAREIGLSGVLESSGVKLVSNTCPTTMPGDYFKRRGVTGIASDAPKLLYNLAKARNIPCYYGQLDKFIDVVTRKA